MSDVKHVSVQAFAELFANKAEFLLLDVRDAWELEEANLSDVANKANVKVIQIPVRQLETRMAEVPKDTAIVCMCHHGGRSKQAALMLSYAGYSDVTNVVGGIHEWSAKIDSSVPIYD
jgi:rhodanese-related sulfurtransferase